MIEIKTDERLRPSANLQLFSYLHATESGTGTPAPLRARAKILSCYLREPSEASAPVRSLAVRRMVCSASKDQSAEYMMNPFPFVVRSIRLCPYLIVMAHVAHETQAPHRSLAGPPGEPQRLRNGHKRIQRTQTEQTDENPRDPFLALRGELQSARVTRHRQIHDRPISASYSSHASSRLERTHSRAPSSSWGSPRSHRSRPRPRRAGRSRA